MKVGARNQLVGEVTEIKRGAKTARRQFFKRGDGVLDFRCLPGLSPRQVRGFEAACVVLVLGLALFVGGFRARGRRCLPRALPRLRHG